MRARRYINQGAKCTYRCDDVEWVGETLIDRVTQSVLPFWVMPEDILDNMLVYPKGYEGIPNSIG